MFPYTAAPRGGPRSIGGSSHGRVPQARLAPAVSRHAAANHRLHARIAFRHLDPEARDEAVTEVVANAYRSPSRGSSNWARSTSPTPTLWHVRASPRSATAATSVAT